MLAYFKDGLLSSWLTEHGCGKTAKQLPPWKPSDSISDNELFKLIYKAIFGKDCTADLEAAFFDIADFKYCEVDGNIIDIQNNKIVLPGNAMEIKFVYKALEDIDSKIRFKISKLESTSERWTVDNKMELCSKGSDFSISFPFNIIGQDREGTYVWDFVSDHEEKLYEMELYVNQRIISLNNGEQLTIYRLNDEKHDFWVTEPILKKVAYNPRGKTQAMLNELNTKTEFHRFRLATRKELKKVVENKVFSGYSKRRIIYYPFFDGRWIRFLGSDLKTIDDVKSFDFVVVLAK